MASEYPHVRRRPTRANRNSNTVRASVLETALELGFAQNSTVADWIFNNPLSEEAETYHHEGQLDSNSEQPTEVAEASTPTFTSGSNSISDESSSLNSPGNCAPSAAITAIQVHTHKPSITEPPQVHFGDFPSDQLQLFSPFALSPHDACRAESRDISFPKHPRDDDRSRSQDDSLRGDPARENSSPGFADTGYTSEGQYLSKGKASKVKGKSGKSKGNKDTKSKVLDSGKTNERDGDYTSDGGYLSASSNKSQGKSPSRVKSRAMAFFRRRPRKSASDDEVGDAVPPVPALPRFPHPSNPKLLERRTAPSSSPRSGFSPLTLKLTSPPASPSRHRSSKSPPQIHAKVMHSQPLDRISAPQRPASPLVASTSPPTVLTPSATAATVPLPPSVPGTPLSTASFPTTLSPPTPPGAGMPKSLTTQPSRQHLGIPPPAPPPTLPLPQPPSSPSISSNGTLPPLPVTPTIPSRRGVPSRSIPLLPTSPGATQPLTPRRTASPLRPLISPRSLPPAVSPRNGEFTCGHEGDLVSANAGRQRSGTAVSAGLGSTPAFLQRKIQHGPPPSMRHPPPDIPLPPSPGLALGARPRTPIGSPSKFHEHFSSVSSVPLSQILSAPPSMSPSASTTTFSESSSGLSVRSSHISSASGRSEEPVTGDSLNVTEYSRPATSASMITESSYGRPITSSFGRPAMDHQSSQFSGRSDVSSSIYSPTTHQDNSSVTTYDGDEDDVDDVTPKSCFDEDDDASIYTSDDKTAGRRTMYLVEYGDELDENGDEVVVTGSRYWADREVPPPVPPLPPMPIRPGPGYF